MKKDEIVDLHSLLNMAANHYLEEEYGVEVVNEPDLQLADPAYKQLDLEDYIEPGAALSQIHGASKKDHRRAIFELAGTLTDEMDIKYEPSIETEVEGSYFERYPSAEEVVRELYENGPAESLIGLSKRVDSTYSGMLSRVDYMVERGWLEDREKSTSRSVFLPGRDMSDQQFDT